jgi:hypothetical protein
MARVKATLAETTSGKRTMSIDRVYLDHPQPEEEPDDDDDVEIEDSEPMNRAEKALAKMVLQKELEAERALELKFIRRLRDEFTAFLEAKGWVKSVDTHYWNSQESYTKHGGVCFLVDTHHPDFGDVELRIEIENGPN